MAEVVIIVDITDDGIKSNLVKNKLVRVYSNKTFETIFQNVVVVVDNSLLESKNVLVSPE